MENIKRKIRLFFITYGRLLFYIIGAIALVILVIQGLNSLVAEQNSKKMPSINNKESINIQKQQQETKADKEYISKFINYCNSGKIEEAYDMLSDKNKEENYSSIDDFKNKYINEVFNINICNYEVTKENNAYIVKLTQDMIATGKTNSTKEGKYKIDGVLEQKIYICNE